MLSKNESSIVNFIKFSPVLLIVLLSIIMVFLMYIDKNKKYEEQINNLRDSFIVENKNEIKEEVNNVYDYIVYAKNSSETQLKSEIKNRVDEVYKIINHLYNKYKDKESKEELISRIKETLREYRFNNGRGYFYIYEKTGKNVLLPSHPHLEGKNFWNHKDSKGSLVIQDMINLLKDKDDAFYEWYWYKPNDKTQMRKKIGVVKNFEPFNWFIGTAEYIDDFEKALKHKVLDYINSIKYDKNGYVFIVDFEGNYLAHYKKAYIGLNRIGLTDKNGVKITQEIIKAAKKGEDYISYIGTIKPETKLPASKTTYIKGLNDWNWAIGTGFYNDELDKKIAKVSKDLDNEYTGDIIYFLTIATALTGLFLMISFYISVKLEKRFEKYKKEVLDNIEENRQKDNLLAHQSKMAAMGEMLENIAHQWRQPLNSISVLASGIKLKKEYGSLEDKDIDEAVDNINNSSKYLSQTINDFRDFFRSDKKLSFFNIKNTFDRTFSLIEPQFNKKDITILKDVDEINVQGYENELIQVFINIFNNARDQLVKLDSHERYIFVNVKKDGAILTISLKDNAGGIAEKIINRIFEPYFTTKHKAKGTGIGLYMSREIITKNFEGEIEVRNSEFIYNGQNYKGAEFIIKITL